MPLASGGPVLRKYPPEGYHPVVNRWIVIFAACAPAALASAQQQEQKLLDRVTKPDMTLANPMQTRTFEGTGDLQPDKKANVSGQVSFADKTFIADSSLKTRSFLGIKNPWFGSRVFDARKARLEASVIPKAEAVYPVDKAEDRKYDPGKTAVTSAEVPLRSYTPRGSAQGAIDSVSDTVKKDLTVDDIRAILNKKVE